MISRAGPALQRLLQSDPALRREIEGAICDFLRKYNRDQPRVPAGNREGGQWTSTGTGQPTSTNAGQGLYGLPLDTSSLLIQPSYSSPAAAPLHTLVHEALLNERYDFPFNEHRNDGTIRPLDPMGDADPSAHPTESLLSSLGLELYRWLSASNGPSSQAVIKFVARGFSRDSPNVPFDLVSVEKLNRQQVKDVCPSIDRVQTLTDAAVDEVMKRPDAAAMSPTQFGTAVHLALEQEINSVGANGNPKYPGFKAEVSAIKSMEADKEVTRGQKGSVRVDVFVLGASETACVYDVKSGRAGLTLPRMKEIADNANRAFGPVRYLIIVEIRPSRSRSKLAKMVRPFRIGTNNLHYSARSSPMPKPRQFNLEDQGF